MSDTEPDVAGLIADARELADGERCGAFSLMINRLATALERASRPMEREELARIIDPEAMHTLKATEGASYWAFPERRALALAAADRIIAAQRGE